LNARIGFPNEHLSGEHNDEIAMPMYSTCIGLILKGYNDYDNKQKQMSANFIKVEHAALLDQSSIGEEEEKMAGSIVVEEPAGVAITQRKSLKAFLDSFKDNLIDIFKEEEDTKF